MHPPAYWKGGRGRYYVMEYSPSTNGITIGFQEAPRYSVQSICTGTLHMVERRVCIPGLQRWNSGRDKDHYCYLLGTYLICNQVEQWLPDHIAESPHWLAAAERLLRDNDGILRLRVVGQMGIDPEKLSVEAQALVVEAAMKYA